MRTLGLGAAGRAGKASPVRAFALPALAFGLLEEDDAEAEGGGKEEALLMGGGAPTRGAEGPQADEADLAGPEAGDGDDDDDDERGGKALTRLLLYGEGREGEEAVEAKIDPLRPAAAEREDWAVDDFRRRTRFPPPLPLPAAETVPGDIPGRMPPGPGRAG